MTNTLNFFLSSGLLLLLSFFVHSCGLSYDEPLLTEPMSTLLPNITLADLKTKYSGATQDKPLLIDADYIARVTVVGNDESGNIYKTLWIEDETGGMPIAVDMSNMSTEYFVGQELLIKLKGLSINVYGGVKQIGYKEEGSKNTRIPEAYFRNIAERNGFPSVEKVRVVKTTLDKLDDSMIGRVVELQGVSWKEAGEPFAVKDENTNRTLTDGRRTLLVRNSGYSLFAADKLPGGKGTVRGVLSKFNSDYQLFLRTRRDVFGFVPSSDPITPPGPGGDDDKPKGDVPTEQGKSAVLLFPGSDFETDADFGKFGLKDASVVPGVGIDDSRALHITGTPEGNNYVFSTGARGFEVGKKYSRISFFVKGSVKGKSLSVNVYDASGKSFSAFNLGVVTGPVLLKPAGSTKETQFVNKYDGDIDTKGKWVLVSLDITGLELNTSGSGNTFAIKDAKGAAHDLYIDNIKIE